MDALNTNQILYHYCSLNTFYNIVNVGNKTGNKTGNKCSLWLSHSDFMDDNMDAKMVKDVFIEWIKDTLKEYDSLVIDKVINKYNSFKNSIFICCFSSNSDSISQWKKYGDDNKGIAIGFSFKNIPTLLNGIKKDYHNFICLDKVQYLCKADILKKFEKYKQEIIDFVDGRGKRYKIANAGLEVFSPEFLYDIISLDYLVKRPEYKTEEEYRLIYVSPYNHVDEGLATNLKILNNMSTIKYRVNKNYDEIIPYYEYNCDTAIEEIILGTKNKTLNTVMYRLMEIAIGKNVGISRQRNIEL